MGIFDKLTGPKPAGTAPHQQGPASNPYPAQPGVPAATHASTGPMTAGGDARPLPPGWEKQWDATYQRYFFIDTRAPGGPQSHWIHPSDQAGASDPRGAPPGPASQPPPGAPYQPYAQPYQPGYAPQYQQPQQQQMAPGPAPNARRPGGMNPMLAGAGGLAGGMLLGSMLEGHHHHHDAGYTSGYEQGYEQGYDNGFENGDDWGADGGDFGGDFF
ncbi:hypothetical protein PTTG_08790 [Puccinia triticina 1-1 BBBD Race 1]|uniref:WW domain-containing protein n=1 Tax=Puccinia triticina (isolate 1-1 / race 1 (BBBD)) TaxID=630390 RepID=A0A180G875_PUCT1|nr:hypothetical protein PTTG_08790 [Puccinia triticina 1-1 BBBD Race 1]